MASRPAKRQKTSVVLSSDDDEPSLPIRRSSRQTTQLSLNQDPDAKLTLSPSRSKNGGKIASRTASKASPLSSPEKNRKNKIIATQSDKIRPIHNFFSKATDEQRWSRKAEPKENIVVDDGELGDAIEDDDIQDESISDWGDARSFASEVKSQSKGFVGDLQQVAASKRGFTSSQRFVKPPIPSKRTISGEEARDIDQQPHAPWADRYGPENLEELAVHKKKVSDVQGWVEDSLSGRIRQKILVLKGSAGTGKTTTLSLLAKSLNVALSSWQNPLSYEAGASKSSGQLFDDFVSRGGLFDSLSFNGSTSSPQTQEDTTSRKVMVVEEFPTTISRSSQALNSFRSTLVQYLARSTSAVPSTFRAMVPKTGKDPPLVIIISETLLTSSTAFNESFTAHRLLGQELLNHPLVTVMEFNPVAPTFITKALDLVIKKEARDSQRRRVPGHAVIQRLSEIGDLRSAINSLEFLCVRNDDSADWSGTVAAKSKKSSKDASLTKMEASSLQLISQRETTLDMFHAAGKVMYNKREDPKAHDTKALPPPKPPDHLMYLYNPKSSQVDVEALLNETGTDIQTFISTLHENYVLSCNGDSFIDSLEACTEILSMSDVLNPESRRMRRNQNSSVLNAVTFTQTTNNESLRQDEISFQVATRGLLFSLPYPVSRAAPASGRKGDAYKMFYPTSLRIWKPTEEIESLISLFANDYDMISATAFSPSHKSINQVHDGGVASWRSRTANNNVDYFTQCQPTSSQSTVEQDDAQPIPTMNSFLTLTLETLPYLTKIRRSQNQDVNMLSKITQLRGSSVPGLEEEASFEDEEPDELAPGQSLPSRFKIQEATQASQSGIASKINGLSSTSTHSTSKLLDLVDSFAAKMQGASNGGLDTSRSGASNRGTSIANNVKQEGDDQTFHPTEFNTRAHPPDMEKLYISDDDIED